MLIGCAHQQERSLGTSHPKESMPPHHLTNQFSGGRPISRSAHPMPALTTLHRAPFSSIRAQKLAGEYRLKYPHQPINPRVRWAIIQECAETERIEITELLTRSGVIHATTTASWEEPTIGAFPPSSTLKKAKHRRPRPLDYGEKIILF